MHTYTQVHIIVIAYHLKVIACDVLYFQVFEFIENEIENFLTDY